MQNTSSVIYCQSLSPKPLPWYMSVLTVLGTAASLWVLVIIHNLMFYLPLNQTARAAVDVILLLVACALAVILFSWRCTQYKYILTGSELILQAVRGSRVVKQVCLCGKLTLLPADNSSYPASNLRFCYKGHKSAQTVTGNDGSGTTVSAVFAPDEQLLEKLSTVL